MTRRGITLSALPKAANQGQVRSATQRGAAPSPRLLKDVCASLEAAGLSVVVVVALEASPDGAARGRLLSEAQRSLAQAGLSVVAGAPTSPAEHGRGFSGAANVLPMHPQPGQLDLSVAGLAAGRPEDVPVVVLTTAANQVAARDALVSGGLGYIVTAPPEGLDGPAAQPAHAERSMQHPAGQTWGGASSAAITAVPHDCNLTPREVEVLQQFANGALTNQVAKELYVSPKTVKNHLAHIYAKLRVATRTQAISIAIKRGIVSID